MHSTAAGHCSSACFLPASAAFTYHSPSCVCLLAPLQDIGRMASKVQPGLFLCGELLDIDGVTGGFNFQSCWTTGHLAGTAAGAFCLGR